MKAEDKISPSQAKNRGNYGSGGNDEEKNNDNSDIGKRHGNGSRLMDAHIIAVGLLRGYASRAIGWAESIAVFSFVLVIDNQNVTEYILGVVNTGRKSQGKSE